MNLTAINIHSVAVTVFMKDSEIQRKFHRDCCESILKVVTAGKRPKGVGREKGQGLCSGGGGLGGGNGVLG